MKDFISLLPGGCHCELCDTNAARINIVCEQCLDRLREKVKAYEAYLPEKEQVQAMDEWKKWEKP